MENQLTSSAALQVQGTGQENRAVSGAASRLFQALDQRGIQYCHWKSNLRLGQGLWGQSDLDLLVDPEQRSVFKQILSEHQARRVQAPVGKRYPGIEDYLGFDPISGNLLHFHVHYQLILGEQFVKNYHLPLEEQFLKSVRLHLGVKIPAPELELIVLSLRALLKYRDRDAVKDMLSIRSPGIPAHILAEIHWLLAQTSIQQVAETLKSISNIVPAGLVVEFLNTVAASPRAGVQLYRLRQRVRSALSIYQRRRRFFAWRTYVFALWRRRKSFLKFRPERKMTLPEGGLTLALVGIDGAGKTTLSQALFEHLASKLDVHRYYLGSKQPSRLSSWLYLGFRIARRSQRAVSRRVGEHNILSRWIAAIRQTLLYSHHLSNGIDRARRYRAGRRNAARGSVVLYDRFPLIGPLDGPQIHLLASGNKTWIANTLSRWEQAVYRQFQPPDVCFVLQVSPEVSLQRKPDHAREAIEAKNSVLSQLISGGGAGSKQFCWRPIQADRPVDEVIRQLKQEVWSLVSYGD